MSRARQAAAVTMLAAVALAGCGLFSDGIPIRRVGFTVTEDANGNAPVPVDVVLIADKDLVASIAGLSAADWFARKEQFLRDAPGRLRVASFELVPGSIIPPRRLERDLTPVAGIVFANYQTPGAHRLRLAGQDEVEIILGERDLALRAGRS